MLTLAIIDDDESIRRGVGRCLRAHGHRVDLFESAEAYLARTTDADCAILDIDLPGISGVELEARLRHDGDETPVVFITGHDAAEAIVAVRHARRPLVLKPIDEHDLLAAIARATGADAGQTRATV